MSLSSDLAKQMKKDGYNVHVVKPGEIKGIKRTMSFVEETREMPTVVLDACEALIWRSACCDSQPSGELSAPWHELKAGGESIVTREGTCAKCGQKANFTRKL